IKMKLTFYTTISALLLISCKKDNGTPDYTFNDREVTIHFDEIHEFEIKQGGKVVNPNTFTFYSSDLAVGTIDNGGLFTAKRIGESDVTAEGPNGSKLSAKVTVGPYYTLYSEPS